MRVWVTVLAAALVAPIAAAQQPIAVGPNVQVSAAAAGEPHFEMLIAADPAHRDRLMACSMVLATARPHNETVTYVSFNRGRSWKLARRVTGDGDRESWDPTCTYGPNGVAYSVSQGRDSTRRPYLAIARSPDGGTTWDSPYRIAPTARPRLTVDASGGPRHGWLYLHGNGGARTTEGTRVSGVEVFVLPNGVQSVRSTFVAPPENNHTTTAGQGVVLSDGRFLGVFGEVLDYRRPDGTVGIWPNVISQYSGRANARLKVLISDDGNRFRVVKVDDFYLRWPAVAGGTTPMLAADATTGPFRDRVYAVWADERSGRLQVYLSYSSDRGDTWSPSAVVGDDRRRPPPGSGPDSFNPTVAVNHKGVVGVAWYDRRDHPENLGWSVRFAASLDGGETFSPSVRVSERDHVPARPPTIALTGRSTASPDGPTNTTIGVHHFHFSAGRTAGLAADAGGVFHPIWSGNATGVGQLWTVAVTVSGTAQRNGGGALAGLADVTEKTAIRFLNRIYHRPRGTVEADVVLANTSSDTLAGPLKVRLLSVDSEVAMARLATTDNGVLGAGGVWDFTPLVEGGRLLPGVASRPRRVRFTMIDVPPYGPGSDAVAGYVQLRARVLAGNRGETKGETK